MSEEPSGATGPASTEAGSRAVSLANPQIEQALGALGVAAALGGIGAGALGHPSVAQLAVGLMLGTGMAWGLARRTRRAAQVLAEQIGRQQSTMAEQVVEARRQKHALEQQTHALEQQAHELERTRDEAVRVAQVKDTFLATMSHELRTPLNAVIGVAGLLGDSDLSEQQREFVDIIGRSSRTLLDLIGDILDMSKLEAGRIEPEQSAFDVVGCVDDALDLVATQALSHGLELVVEVSPSVPRTVVSDVGRLRQILMNLLSNAVKFTSEGEIAVRIDATSLDAGSWRLSFEVEDTGIGIPPDRLDRLFLPFSQVDSSTTREYGGTGLGLVISRALAELLGGQMGVRSEPGRGSTFFFSITAHEPTERTSLVTGLVPRRVLVVDAHARSRAATAALVRRLGGEAFEAASADEALAIAARPARLDAALVDRQLLTVSPTLLDDLGVHVPSVIRLVPRGTRQGPASDVGLSLSRPVRLTALEAVLRASHDEPLSVRRERSFGQVLPGQRILVVEDNALNRRVLLKMLERLGHSADSVESGPAALEATARETYQVILLDVNMPEMDGYTVASELRRRHRRRRRPRVIGVTANALPGDREKCLAAGMDDYLSKPIEMDALAHALAGPTAATEASLSQSNLLDPNVIQRLREGPEGDQRLLRACEQFLAEGGTLLQTLLDACERRDQDAAQRAAQPLLHHARVFGAVQLAAALLGVDMLLRATPDTETTERLTDLAQRLHVLFDRTEQAVIRLTHVSSQPRVVARQLND